MSITHGIVGCKFCDGVWREVKIAQVTPKSCLLRIITVWYHDDEPFVTDVVLSNEGLRLLAETAIEFTENKEEYAIERRDKNP